MNSVAAAVPGAAPRAAWRVALEVFKPRIALEIMLAGVAGVAITGGPGLAWEALLVLAVSAAGLATNWLAAAYVFLGAFTYGVVYTLWLKRRTWLNIVIGGLAGSFAVLAGAAAVDPTPGPAAWTFAVVLFLWTPPHFWSLATYYRQDYADAGVPMLPVVHGDRVAARAILGHTIPLVLLSLLPVVWGAGPIYLVCAASGGAYFIWRAYLLLRSQTPSNAIRSFLASLLQLGLLLLGAIVEGAIRGSLVHL
jgi:protoheme IX farnesyltransferase